MGGLGHVFFQVNAIEADYLAEVRTISSGGPWGSCDRRGERRHRDRGESPSGWSDSSWACRGRSSSCDPTWRRGGAAPEHQAGEESLLDRILIENGQGSGKAEAGGAGVGIGLVAKGGGAGAEHFGFCFDLTVNFESDGGNILHGAPLF